MMTTMKIMTMMMNQKANSLIFLIFLLLFSFHFIFESENGREKNEWRRKKKLSTKSPSYPAIISLSLSSNCENCWLCSGGDFFHFFCCLAKRWQFFFSEKSWRIEYGMSSDCRWFGLDGVMLIGADEDFNLENCCNHFFTGVFSEGMEFSRLIFFSRWQNFSPRWHKFLPRWHKFLPRWHKFLPRWPIFSKLHNLQSKLFESFLKNAFRTSKPPTIHLNQKVLKN